jgi:ankyrin repeat domain-containing protein 50
MYSRDEYTVGWICALPLEMAAAKAMLDSIHPDLPADPRLNDTNAYILGSLKGHNVVVACLPVGVYGTTSAATVATQMLASFKSIRFSLMVGVGGGVPNTREDIRLGDVVVSRPTAARPGIIQFDFGKKGSGDQFTTTGVLNKPSTLLLTAAGKVETNTILRESRIPSYIDQIVEKDPNFFSRPSPDDDILFESDYTHTPDHTENVCDRCDPDRIRVRPPRESQDPKVHYGLVASGNQVMRDGTTRDRLAQEHGILCFEMEAAGLIDITQCLVIRGICDYADSHKSKRWQGYAAAAAAAYAKEMLSLIPTAPKPDPLVSVSDSTVTSILEALLLTRPEVDRSSLVALKGRRVDGTCEWLKEHSRYQEWLDGVDPPLLWISGGPGKGKTMLAIYITEELQPVAEASHGVLLYYFCSNRDKNRNTTLTIMRGVLHQWLSFHPELAHHMRTYFDGPETTKYTVSSFICLWKLFLIMLRSSTSSEVVLVLDGLDECEEDSLKELLDVLREYLLETNNKPTTRLKLILLSRPNSGPLESGLRPFPRIKLDDSDVDVSKDVERYISAKVAELAAERILSEERLQQVRRVLMANADDTFLWVGFVANELKGRSWLKTNDILHSIPKGLGGIYRRLLEQVEDKEKLVPILQWVVLAARPMTLDELAVAAGIKPSSSLTPAEMLKDRLASCGLLVKIEGNVVNLVHESAREFFHSEQISVDGISMFRMTHNSHRSLVRTCLALIEGTYRHPGSIGAAAPNNTLLTYASLYWPDHFRQAFGALGAPSDFSRQFFQAGSAVREDWWSFYWQREQCGGVPPTFTLLHLASYFGNLPWTKLLLEQSSSEGIPFRRYISRKDSCGRTPLFWAATRGHREVVELLLDHGAKINSRDRSHLTPLHIAVTGQHKEVVALLLSRAARIEDKASYDETPLMRAIQANSKDIVTMLLEHGAHVDSLPAPSGVASLRGPMDPISERADELLQLQEQLFAARYEYQSKQVDTTIKLFTMSMRIRPIFKLISLYVRHVSLGRWEALQDLVKNNDKDRLRKWAHSWIMFGRQLVKDRDPKGMEAMTGLSVKVFQAVSALDLEALMVIGVLVGSGVILIAATDRWREGVEIAARTFAQFASLACRTSTEESLDYGVREFMIDTDAAIRGGKGEETEHRMTVLFSTLYAIVATEDSWPIDYFSTVIREFCEGFIGASYDAPLFDSTSHSCATELSAISEEKDSAKLAHVLTAIFHIAQGSKGKGQDWFFNLLPAVCLILCSQNPNGNRWLIGEAIPEITSGLISRAQSEPIRKRAFKALMECLVIGGQYGISSPSSVWKTVKLNLNAIEGADEMLDQFLSP